MTESEYIRPEWLDLVREDIVDPERSIIDTHHHLWGARGLLPYTLDDLWSDTESGHRVEKTIFMECGAEYRSDGPEHLRSLGEIEFIADAAEMSARDPQGRAQIVALVSNIDLMRGDAIEEVVHLHEEKSRGLFRGVRHAGASARKEDGLMLTGGCHKL